MEASLYRIIFWQVITNLVAFIILGILVIIFLNYRLKANRNSLSLHPEKNNRRKPHRFFAVYRRKREKQRKQAKAKKREKIN